MVSMQTLVTGTSNRSPAIGRPGQVPVRLIKQPGFSLLELLVVIVIISILFTFSTLAIRGTSAEELIQTEARRLDRIVQLAMEEAILKGEEYGLEFKPNSYRFLRYRENKWQPMSDDKLLRQRELPEGMEFELEIENTEVVINQTRDDDDENDKEKFKPQVFLLSSGEISPAFNVRLVMPGVSTSYIVSGYVDGNHDAKLSEL